MADREEGWFSGGLWWEVLGLGLGIRELAVAMAKAAREDSVSARWVDTAFDMVGKRCWNVKSSSAISSSVSAGRVCLVKGSSEAEMYDVTL